MDLFPLSKSLRRLVERRSARVGRVKDVASLFERMSSELGLLDVLFEKIDVILRTYGYRAVLVPVDRDLPSRLRTLESGVTDLLSGLGVPKSEPTDLSPRTTDLVTELASLDRPELASVASRIELLEAQVQILRAEWEHEYELPFGGGLL